MVRKGSTLLEESRRKISESLKGKPGHKHTEEAKEKIAEKARQRHKERREENLAILEKARKARGPVTEETRKKLSEAGKRRFKDPDEREKQSHRQKALWTEDARDAIRKERQKRWENPEFREKVIIANTGKKRSKETKRKIAEKARERWGRPEFKQKMKPHLEALKRDISGENNPMYGKHHTEKARKKIVNAMWKRLKDNLTPLELSVAKVLDSLNVEFELQKIIGVYIVDFYIPARNLIIEADGNWHNEPERKERDRKRDRWLKSRGYHIIRIKEPEIKKNAKEAVEKALNEKEAD